MTFDTWIDAVNQGVRAELGSAVHTEELSWDSAMWVGPAGTVVAALDNDGATALISADGRVRASFPYVDTTPSDAVSRVVARLR